MDNQSVTSPEHQILVRIRLTLENMFQIDRYRAQAAIVALAEQRHFGLAAGICHTPGSGNGAENRHRLSHNDDAWAHHFAKHAYLGALRHQQPHTDFRIDHVLAEIRSELAGDLIDSQAGDVNIADERMV